MKYSFIHPFLASLILSFFIYYPLEVDLFGINFYERFELITKFCKVEFVCFSGEPNWLGELFLFAPFFLISWLIMTILFLIDINKGGGWFFHNYK